MLSTLGFGDDPCGGKPPSPFSPSIHLGSTQVHRGRFVVKELQNYFDVTFATTGSPSVRARVPKMNPVEGTLSLTSAQVDGLAALIWREFYGASGSIQCAWVISPNPDGSGFRTTRDAHGSGTGASVPPVTGPPEPVRDGIYSSLDGCHACGYNNWQLDLLNAAKSKGLSAFPAAYSSGGGIRRSSFSGWTTSVWMGPFHTADEAGKLALELPKFLAAGLRAKRTDPVLKKVPQPNGGNAYLVGDLELGFWLVKRGVPTQCSVLDNSRLPKCIAGAP